MQGPKTEQSLHAAHNAGDTPKLPKLGAVTGRLGGLDAGRAPCVNWAPLAMASASLSSLRTSCDLSPIRSLASAPRAKAWMSAAVFSLHGGVLKAAAEAARAGVRWPGPRLGRSAP